MSLDSVRAFLAQRAPEIDIVDQGASTATVAHAAAALGVEPGRIAKTLSIRVNDRQMPIVTRGSSRLHNPTTTEALGCRPPKLRAADARALPGPQPAHRFPS